MSNPLSDIAAGKVKRQLGSSGGSGDDSPVVAMNVGDRLVGKYLGSSSYPSKFNAEKSVSYHRFEKADGEKFTLRSKGDLDDMMEEADAGMLLEIERVPDKTTKSGYPFAQFSVCELVEAE